VGLFLREQELYDNAVAVLLGADDDSLIDIAQFGKMVEEYGKLLKQFKRYREATSPEERNVRHLDTDKHEMLNTLHYDVLTGIFNKRYLDEHIESILQNMGRMGDVVSIVKADVDFFKQFNDLYGHAAGDTCLRSVAEALKTCLYRNHDFVVRYGGEEFIAVMPHTNEDGARRVADRMLEKVRALKVPHSTNDAFEYVTISIGLVTGEKNPSGWAPEELYGRVEEALLKAKSCGKNQYAYLGLSL